MDDLHTKAQYNELYAHLRGLESVLQVDPTFRVAAMAIMMTIYKERYLALDAYAAILQDAIDIQTETEAFLGSSDVQ